MQQDYGLQSFFQLIASTYPSSRLTKKSIESTSPESEISELCPGYKLYLFTVVSAKLRFFTSESGNVKRMDVQRDINRPKRYLLTYFRVDADTKCNTHAGGID